MGKQWLVDTDGWSTKNGKNGGGGTFLQKALEGAVVSALGLADFGAGGGSRGGWGKGSSKGAPADKGQKGDAKGGGKGSAKGGGSAGDACTPCWTWDDCPAAQRQQATWGGWANCFKCRRPFSQQPPLERLAPWAWDKKFQGSTAKAADPVAVDTTPKGKGKGGGKGKTDADAKTVEQLATLRKERLAALKSGVAVVDDAATAQPSAIKDAMAVHLVDSPTAPPSPIVLDKELLEQLQVFEANV